jgi:hypothetical protein
MRGYARILLSGHVAAKPRVTQAYARFRLRFRSFVEGGAATEQSLHVFARTLRLKDCARALVTNTPVMIEGTLVGRSGRYYVDASDIVVMGDAQTGVSRPAADRSEHKVVGHDRTLASGRVVWVSPHKRGKRRGALRRP